MIDPNALKFFIYIVIVLSAVFHEYAHGLMAYKLGDSTAKDAGRLTLNPLRHIDPIGTVVLPLFLLYIGGIFIGWAKPVPYNPFNLSDKKYGSLKVGIAGPGANLLIAILLSILSFLAPIQFVVKKQIIDFVTSGRLLDAINFSHSVGSSLAPAYVFICIIIYVNIFLALFNLIPLPPLDGSKVLMDLYPRASYALARLGFIGIFLALFLAFEILPYLANFLFLVITGYSFGF